MVRARSAAPGTGPTGSTPRPQASRAARGYGQTTATVVLIDATDVVLVEPLPSLLDALGEPETRLNSFQGTFEVESQ